MGSMRNETVYMSKVTGSPYRFPIGITTVISGLTVRTSCWFDLSLAAITGDTASLNNLELVITEL